MTILCTMPGHFGDILWALPTMRLLAKRHDTKVDFLTSPPFEPILELVQRQPYILETWTGKDWIETEDTAEYRVPPTCDCGDYEEVYHLGYSEWPTDILSDFIRESVGFRDDPPLHMTSAWVRAGDIPHRDTVIAVSFTENHIELKMGILLGLIAQLPVDITWKLLLPPKGLYHRAWEWVEVAGYPVEFCETNWVQAAAEISSADLFFGCLSAPWVLANAVGTPTVIMEPMEARHNPIFWRNATKNHLVIGNDDKPTFDLRATRDMIKTVLGEVRNG